MNLKTDTEISKKNSMENLNSLLFHRADSHMVRCEQQGRH